MGAKIYISIENEEGLKDILTEGQSKGLFRTLPVQAVMKAVEGQRFPIRIPVELDDILSLCGHPLVQKVCGPKVDKAIGRGILKALEGGA